MKKLLMALTALVMFFTSSGVATAAPITGSISATTGGGMFATESWANNPKATLTWSVSSQTVGQDVLWTYHYQFTVGAKAISHVLFQVSDTFTEKNIFEGTTPFGNGDGLGTWGDEGKSSPGILSTLYSIKFGGNDLDDEFTIVTDRAPMWGSFYAKDGKDEGGEVYAYNTSFGLTSTVNIFGTAPQGFVLVPDTRGGDGGGGEGNVPEPGSLALAGAGLILLGLGRRRTRKS